MNISIPVGLHTMIGTLAASLLLQSCQCVGERKGLPLPVVALVSTHQPNEYTLVIQNEDCIPYYIIAEEDEVFYGLEFRADSSSDAWKSGGDCSDSIWPHFQAILPHSEKQFEIRHVPPLSTDTSRLCVFLFRDGIAGEDGCRQWKVHLVPDNSEMNQFEEIPF